MKFRTEYDAKRSSMRLSPHRRVVCFGSCFAENICARMRDHLWDASRPAGVLYNPSSVSSALRLLLDGNPELPEWSIVENEGRVHSLLFDSRMSGRDKEETNEKFLKASRQVNSKLTEGADLIITFGTAWVFETAGPGNIETGGSPNVGTMGSENVESERSRRQIVGNCHKLPSASFHRRLLGINEIADDWCDLTGAIKKRYPGTRFIFTVSPVRHLKDGPEGNSLSKAILRVSIDEIIGRCRQSIYGQKLNEDMEYFPAFEILNDDLRDYRFYASDLVHPSDSAIDYIWEKFTEEYLDKNYIDLLKKGKKIADGLRHRPIMETGNEEISRWEELFSRWRVLSAEWPEMINPFA